jgi:hypothetical protein
MIGIEQQLDGSIVDGLYAALDASNPPSASNAFATMADVSGGGGDKVVNTGEPLLTANVSVVINTTGIQPLQNFSYPVVSASLDGYTRTIKFTGTFSRTGSPSATITFRFTPVIAGTTINFPSISVVGPLSNAQLIGELTINYRAGGICNVTGIYQIIDQATIIATVAANSNGVTWDQAISNTINNNVQVQTFSGGGNAQFNIYTLRSFVTPLIFTP